MDAPQGSDVHGSVCSVPRWFLTWMMQRKLSVRRVGVKQMKLCGPGLMPALGQAPGALVTICTARGCHPGVTLRVQNVLIDSRACSSFELCI